MEGVVAIEGVRSAGRVSSAAAVKPALGDLGCPLRSDGHRRRGDAESHVAAAAHHPVLGVPHHVRAGLEADRTGVLADQQLEGSHSGVLLLDERVEVPVELISSSMRRSWSPLPPRKACTDAWARSMEIVCPREEPNKLP